MQFHLTSFVPLMHPLFFRIHCCKLVMTRSGRVAMKLIKFVSETRLVELTPNNKTQVMLLAQPSHKVKGKGRGLLHSPSHKVRVRMPSTLVLLAYQTSSPIILQIQEVLTRLHSTEPTNKWTAWMSSSSSFQQCKSGL